MSELKFNTNELMGLPDFKLTKNTCIESEGAKLFIQKDKIYVEFPNGKKKIIATDL